MSEVVAKSTCLHLQFHQQIHMPGIFSLIFTINMAPSLDLRSSKLRPRERVRRGSGPGRCLDGTCASAQALKGANADFMHAADTLKTESREREPHYFLNTFNSVGAMLLLEAGLEYIGPIRELSSICIYARTRSEDDTAIHNFPLPTCQQLRCHLGLTMQILPLS